MRFLFTLLLCISVLALANTAFAQEQLPIDGEHIASLGQGKASPYVIKADGTLWQLSAAFEADPEKPWFLPAELKDEAIRQIGAALLMRNVRSVAGDNEIMFATLTDGTVWVWGNTRSGLSGNGLMEQKTDYPVQVHISQVSTLSFGFMGWGTAFAVKTDGSLWGWGAGTSYMFSCPKKGEAPDNVTTPVKLMDGVRKVAHGNLVIFAIDTRNQLWAWGERGYIPGKFADTGSYEYSQIDPKDGKQGVARCKPKVIMTNVSDVAANQRGVFVIKTDGSLWAWGDNRFQDISAAFPTRYLPPTKLADKIKIIFAGENTAGWINGRNALMISWTASIMSTTGKKPISSNIAIDVAECAQNSKAMIFRKLDGSLWLRGFDFASMGIDGLKMSSYQAQVVLPPTPEGIPGKFDADIERGRSAAVPTQ